MIFLNPASIKLSIEPIDQDARYRILLLCESIRENGLMFPVTVRKQGKDYYCVCGEKRIRASILAGKKKIPCIEGIVCESELYKAVEVCKQKKEVSAYSKLFTSLLKKHSKERLATCLCLSTRELDAMINQTKPIKKETEEAKELTSKPNHDIKEKAINFKPVKDKRFFINSIRKAVDSMKESGIDAVLSQKETAKSVEIKVTIKKTEEDFLQISLPEYSA